MVKESDVDGRGDVRTFVVVGVVRLGVVRAGVEGIVVDEVVSVGIASVLS